MKIVQIIDTLNVGGAERVLITLANLLYNKGHGVTVITLLEPGHLAGQLLSQIPLIALKRKWKWNPITMNRLVKLCRNADVVHVHSSHNLRYLFIASRLFRLKKTIFFHEHFGDIEINNSVKWHQQFIYPRTVLIGVSSKICDWAVQKVKMPPQKVYLLLNTVPKLIIPKDNKQDSREELKLLMVANIRTTKHIEFAINLTAELRQKNPVTLTVIGKVTDPAYYETLTKLINKKKLQYSVEFIHTCDSIQSILQYYDIAIHTAKSESGPLVLIEYMAQGLPFITYQTGEVVNKLKDDLPDFMMKKFDVPAWIDAIENLQQQDIAYLQKRMTNTYDQYFSEEIYYQKCLEIYQKDLPSS